MAIERFVVDARLLRELGERLVGQPHIALAEVIKNSYDADARSVRLYFSDDRIRIVDDGHGMSHADFSERWLTIGTTVKERDRESPELRRPFTGSKGVGRLAVQLLAHKLELRTVGLRDPTIHGRYNRANAGPDELHSEVVAEVDWDLAVNAGNIDKVEVHVTDHPPSTRFADDSACGTEITLTGLTRKWDADSFRLLARELWPLQPPFAVAEDDEAAFHVVLHSAYEDVVQEFNSQMQAILEIWTARVSGYLMPPETSQPEGILYELRNTLPSGMIPGPSPSSAGRARYLRLTVEIRRGATRDVTFRIPNCHIDELAYEIRIFSLQHRQPRGVKVETARQYMLTYGGVHIYDAKFHLPYYGPESDWLKIEQDHARRMSVSRLLPAELNIPRGMNDLVPNARLYGAVQVSTTHEAEMAQANNVPVRDVLTVQITRDRLVDNAAFAELRNLVRSGLDLYAMETARAKFAEAEKRRADVNRPPSASLRETGEALSTLRDSVPNEDRATFDLVTQRYEEAVADAEAMEAATRVQTSIVGALATAGMTMLAYDHEISKQIATLEKLSRQLASLALDAPARMKPELDDASKELRSLAQRTKRIREIFAPLNDEEDRTSDDAGAAFDLIKALDHSLDTLARGTKIDYDSIPRDLRFPLGGYPAWWSIFQNLFINAFNATLDSGERRIRVDSGHSMSEQWIRVQDTGIGIDLEDAERLFEPFERGRPISRERAALGLGGTGLGLTIVRLVASQLGVTVNFDIPDPGYSTSVRISWKLVK